MNPQTDDLKYTTTSKTSTVKEISMVDRLKPLAKRNDDKVSTFYDPTVEKIVKTKMNKFTYGDEVEVGALMPSE